MENSPERRRQIEKLYAAYAHNPSLRRRFVRSRKKIVWACVVGGAKLIKRMLDILLSISLLIILSPLFLLISLAIKLYDGGPVLFITDRIGKGGKPFRFPKFRSMYVDADQRKKDLIAQNQHQNDKKFKIKGDPRVTWVGHILRRFSLDELPQLWCVLKGEMSLVGPRPPLPQEVDVYTLEDRKRLDVKPGLTCIWQVSGRSEIPFDTQVHLDLQYIESQSLWLDFKLLLKTIPAVIMGRGAY